MRIQENFSCKFKYCDCDHIFQENQIPSNGRYYNTTNGMQLYIHSNDVKKFKLQ